MVTRAVLVADMADYQQSRTTQSNRIDLLVAILAPLRGAHLRNVFDPVIALGSLLGAAVLCDRVQTQLTSLFVPVEIGYPGFILAAVLMLMMDRQM